MYNGIILSIYFSVGLFLSFGLLKYIEHLVNKKEDDRLDDKEEVLLEEIDPYLGILFEKRIISVVFVASMLFWLPAFIVSVLQLVKKRS